MVFGGGPRWLNEIRMLLKAGAVIASFSFTDWATGAGEDGDEAWVRTKVKNPTPCSPTMEGIPGVSDTCW